MQRSDLPVVFLIDVDNTLLDNDRFGDDLDARLVRDFGEAEKDRYRSIYKQLWKELEYADYLGAVQRFRAGVDEGHAHELMQLADFIVDYPFADNRYPQAMEAVAHLGTLGTSVVLSDGDMAVQPRKVRRSGLWDAVDGRVSIFIHKQDSTEAVQRLWPGRHHVMVDDKPLILAAMKRAMGDALTTVFVRQGHYATEQQLAPDDPQPDRTIERIGALVSMALGDFPGASAA